jgi:hypothetical protein
MKFANEGQINTWRRLTTGRGDNLESAVLILRGVMDDADNNSDGWAYWAKPCNACKQLIELIERSFQAGSYAAASPPYPIHAADLRKALAPIRGFYTRQHKIMPTWPAMPRHLEPTHA